MKPAPGEALAERVARLEFEVAELRSLVELQSLVLKRLRAQQPTADDRPVEIPDADTVRVPDEELALLVGAEPGTLRALVGRLAENDLEELRDGAVGELDRRGRLWPALVALNEDGRFDDPEALGAVVRGHSTLPGKKRPARRR